VTRTHLNWHTTFNSVLATSNERNIVNVHEKDMTAQEGTEDTSSQCDGPSPISEACCIITIVFHYCYRASIACIALACSFVPFSEIPPPCVEEYLLTFFSSSLSLAREC
jgi:hypothetical protein